MCIDFLHIEDDNELHLLDVVKPLNTARLVGKHVTTEKVCEPIMKRWLSVIASKLHEIVVDENKHHGNIFVKLSEIYRIYVKKRGREIRSMDKGDRYHNALRKNFSKLGAYIPYLKLDVNLAINTNEINNTLNLRCIVQSASIFEGLHPYVYSLDQRSLVPLQLGGRLTLREHVNLCQNIWN